MAPRVWLGYTKGASAVSTSTASLGQNYGEVFTRRWVVDTLLDLTGYTVNRDLGALTLVEPAAGSGAFLLPVVERLLDSADLQGRPAATLGSAIRAWELRKQNAEVCRERVRAFLIERGVTSADAQSLMNDWIVVGDFLLPDDDLFTAGSGPVLADVVIGNPPYIRLEDLPESLTNAYRRRWSTMGGRADVYIGFMERSLSVLRPGGRVGFICADRWMRNQYGTGLRRLIALRFSVEHVWAMHDVDAFESQVSAYPAITVLRTGVQGEVVAAETKKEFGRAAAAQLVEWSKRSTERREFMAPGVAAHRLTGWFGGDKSWPTGSPARLRLIEYLNENFGPLHDVGTGTKVSIGVATGADQVFITKDVSVVEPSRLLPLSMVCDIGSGQFTWSGHYLVDPWGKSGRLVNLTKHPGLRDYLMSAGAVLHERHVAKKAPHAWYRTIDKVHHDVTDRPKLLLQDMRTTINPVLEPGGYYPHHNLYFIVSDTWDMEILGGLLLSRVAQAFIEAYCVRMRGGTLRFQSQYLKRIRVPEPSAIDTRKQDALRVAFRERDIEGATAAAAAVYGITLKDYDLDRAVF
ncbi:MAG: Eco57I restriction-modification methylase domain-containing protein [Mycobacteriales bacterium]